MSRIDLVHPHSLAQDQIRQVVDEVELQPRQVRVVAELGLLLSAMRGIVEQEIRRALAEKLG